VIHNDFVAPVLDGDVPAGAPGLFGAPGQTSGGPCLFEPEIGTLFPRNWLRPRFRFNAANQENLFEIKITVPNEQSPLFIYTRNTTYALDAATWKLITTLAAGEKLHVTVRSAVESGGAITAGPFAGSEGDIEIAPVDAAGTIVYWTTSNGTQLKGFQVGDETVQTVVTPAQGNTQCVACHTSTPDGKFVAATASDNPGDGSPGYVRLLSLDGKAAAPAFVTPSAASLLTRTPQHAPAFSLAHWAQGDHTMLSMMPVNGRSEITWTDLEATGTAQGQGWGIIARTGDDHAASAATMSHDGKTIVYTSTSNSAAGTISTDGAIFTVPYANRQGGAAQPVAGASDAAYHHFYPSFSADDQLLALNRIPAGQTSYNNPTAEVYVVPAAGGTATRLVANDPPACLGTKSPGITNSWPKWSPSVNTVKGKSYYFLVFSSTRNPGSNGPQLYVSPIVVENGTVTTYAALYLWNQPELENNHTPAWDVFKLQPPN
jgi:mono/diheme cytochrome c family protein